VYDFEQNRYHSYTHIGEKKTGKWKAIALNKTVAAASRLCFGSEMGQPADFLFRTSRKARAAVGMETAGNTSAPLLLLPVHLPVGLLQQNSNFHRHAKHYSFENRRDLDNLSEVFV